MPTSQYQALIKDFATHAGLEAFQDEQAIGVDFEVNGYVCRVLPHPQQEERLSVEVDVCRFSSEQAQPSQLEASLLLRLNALSRTEHDWTLGLDEDGHLILWTWREVAATPPAELEALLVEGIDRAEALHAALRPISDKSGAAESASHEAEHRTSAEPLEPIGALRG